MNKDKNPLAGRFSGTVQSDDGPIVVQNGFAVVDGELFMVSDDGFVITNKDGNIVGVVANGRVKQLTPELVSQLRKRGYVK
jgi:hypothetical protein